LRLIGERVKGSLMRTITPTTVGSVGAGMLSSLACGQTALVRTTANGGASAAIQTGESVTIEVNVLHDRYLVAGLAGGSFITGSAGTTSGFQTPLTYGPTIVLGWFEGGSRVGADIALVPDGFMMGPPYPSNLSPMPVWRCEIVGLEPGEYAVGWHAPRPPPPMNVTLTQPGVFDVVWVPTASSPNVPLYASISSFSFTEAQTTYIGARITVTPGVSTACAVMVGRVGGVWRRRRG